MDNANTITDMAKASKTNQKLNILPTEQIKGVPKLEKRTDEDHREAGLFFRLLLKCGWVVSNNSYYGDIKHRVIMLKKRFLYF